ncbi:hypothetical protein [Marinobacter sp.]|uniref:hypothetical protein n=1 Tax=Marinobacter sp. TaxID=50741 RepID=UPI00384E42F6
MPEVYFAQKPTAITDLIGHDSSAFEAFLKTNGLSARETIQPGRAYSLEQQDAFTLPALRHLNSLPVQDRMCIARSAESMGNEAHVLRAFYEENLTPEKMAMVNGLVGAGATAAFTRLSGFQKTLVKYQEAILNLVKLQKAKGPGIGTRRLQAETMVRNAYRTLREAYQTELNRLSPESFRNKNRGNALSNADRAITLATRNAGRKPDPRLYVADSADAGRVGSLGRFLNNTGRVAIAVDAGFRVNNIHSTYQDGGDWLRESSLQMAGFGLGGAAGGLTGKYTVIGGTALAAKAGLLVAGPVGWAVLGVIVGAGLLAGLTAGRYIDGGAQTATAWIWDRNGQ